MIDKKIVIVSALRTPFDKYGGVMKDIRSIDLGTEVIRQVVERVGLPKDQVDYIFYGTTIHAEVAADINVPVRQALLHAGFPSSTLSLTVDRACCSSMAAFTEGVREIQAGEAEVVIAAGAENLSHVPHLTEGLRWGKKMGDFKLYDVNAGFNYPGFGPVSVDTDNVARREGVSREEMDRWSFRSQQLYQEANAAGRFADEIIPYTVHTKKGDIVVTEDQGPRADTTYEKLAALKPVYGTQAITAGNSPGMNAGASAILLMTEEKARRLSGVKYHGDYIFAFDHISDTPQVRKGLEIWRRYSDKSTKLYVLSGFESQGAEEIASIFERIRILMEYQCLPYIMRHENYAASPYKGMFITLARWCNQPNFLKKKSFRQFCEANGLTSSAYRYMAQFEHDHPDIAKKYFDIRFDRRGGQ